MIVVTVGTEQYQFNRLMSWVATLIENGFIQEEVVVQYGSCTELPPGVRVYQSLPGDRFADLVKQARLVISHCGEGSLLLLEDLKKPYILVPRSVQFGEHVDDHQVELATALQALGGAIANSPGDLARFIQSPSHAALPALSEHRMDNFCQKLHRRFGRPTAVASTPARVLQMM